MYMYIHHYSPSNGSIEEKEIHIYKKYTINENERRNKQYATYMYISSQRKPE